MHLAIIMDGNRRWATEKGLPKIIGHSRGADNLEKVSKHCIELGVRFLTVYALSTENLQNRSKKEIDHLMKLIEKFAQRLPEFEKHGIRINTIGNIDGLSKKSEQTLKQLEQDTNTFSNLTLTLAINYGGRDEICRTIQKIQNSKRKIKNERDVSKYLDTTGLPEVDLVVRTGGAIRISNFLLWQIAYAELYFTKVKWPAFGKRELTKAIEYFESTKRNHGK